jgi:2,3-bisphosphoglycerate-independent phosphoglycerate mutase
VERRARGLRPANSVWPWGEGTKPNLKEFEVLFHKKGAMISAVDLLKGIAIAAKMTSIDVEGATGNIHTNYQGKVDAAIKTLEEGHDFVYIHIEAPDECGHRGERDNKIKAIELIDEKVVKPLMDYFNQREMDYKLALLPDHPTPLRIRTHTSEPVPYFIYTSNKETICPHPYTELGAKNSGKMIEKGYEFMPYFLGRK